jgi:hypothetical protein
MRLRRLARLVLAVALLGGQLLLFAAAAAAADITSTGPLTRVIVTPDLNCQVGHVEDELFELYGDEIGSCGTFLVVNGSLFAPELVPLGTFPIAVTPWTPVGQSAVSGNGTAATPYKIVTTVDAAGTGLRVEQTDSYVLGTQQYRTDVVITNTGSVAQSGALYRAGDCYLQEHDDGYGRVDDGSPACIASAASNSRIEQWTPLTAGSHFMEGYYGFVYGAINGEQFPNTCECTYGELDAVDNGAGLSWPVSVAPGQSVTISHDTFFSPTGRAPVTTSYVQSVPDPTQINLDPVVVVQTVAVTAGVILLVPFPSALFNSTLEDNYDEVMAGVNGISRRVRALWLALVARVRAEIGRRRNPSDPGAARTPETIATTPDHPLGGPLPGTGFPGPELSPRATAVVEPVGADSSRDVWRTPLGILAFVGISALLYAFLDPTFGFSLESLATLAGLALGLLIILFAYGAPLALFSRNHRLGLTVRALPATLIVAVICILVSRLSGFQPGYLYGLIVGFFFAHAVTHEVEGKAEAAAAGVSLFAAFVAWIALVFLRGSGSTDTFTNALVQSAAVTVVVAGLENAVFAMLPLRFLPGSAVYSWNRVAWVVLIGLGIFGFAHVLLNPTTGAGYLADTTRTSFFTLVALLVVFGIASVVFWAWFRFRPDARRSHGPGL